MKEKITLYKQRHLSLDFVTINAIKLESYEVLSSVEVEVEFPKIEEPSAQRMAIRQSIKLAKAKHKLELDRLEKQLEEA